MKPILLFFLSILACCAASNPTDSVNGFGQSVKVVMVQSNDLSLPLASIDIPINKNAYNINDAVTVRPLADGVNTFAAIGIVSMDPSCSNCTQIIDTPLATTTTWGARARNPMLRYHSFDPANRARTRADVPFKIFYTATTPPGLPTDVSPFFQVVRAVLSGPQGLAKGHSVDRPNNGNKYAIIPADLGTDIPLKLTLSSGTVTTYHYALNPSPNAPMQEEGALLFYADSNAPSADVAAWSSLDVLPLPIASLDKVPSGKFTNTAALPTLTINCANLYPGHTTWAVLTPSSPAGGAAWISRPIQGSSAGQIIIPLAEILPTFSHDNNTITLEVWSEHAVAEWRRAISDGSGNAFGREQLLQSPPSFTLDLSGSVSIHLNTL